MTRSSGELVRAGPRPPADRSGATVRLGCLFEPQRLPHHEKVGQHGERGVMVPALPAVAVIVAQAEKLLADLEALLDRSVQGGQPHQPVRGQVGRTVAQMAFELVRGRVAAQ